MKKLAKPLSLFKERNCSVSIVLDSRTRRKNACEFLLSLRFMINRKFLYFTVGSFFTKKKFLDICNATKCKSENYRFRKEWKDIIAPKYKKILMNLNKGGILTFETAHQCIMGEEVGLSKKDTTQSQPFISIWEQVIHELCTEDGGARFITAENYERSLKSFRKIPGENAIRGFRICAAELQKRKDGMHNGVKDENGTIVGKTSDTTAGVYLRCCRAVWNKCVHGGYLKGASHLFSNKKEKGLVSIPKSAKRKQSFLNVNQMTELYGLFVSKEYPEHWSEGYVQRAHYPLGLFLVQYLCNGFNMVDVGRLTHNSYYYQTNDKAFRFNRKKTSRWSADSSEVIVPIVPPLRYILDEIVAPQTRNSFVFSDILKGVETEELRRKYTMQENSNVKDRVIKIYHETLNWNKSIRPPGTQCRHSFATNLHNAEVDMDYISESMEYPISDYAITQIHVEHYPLNIQMQNNLKLLNLENSSERDVLLAKLAVMSIGELLGLFRQP